MHRYLNGLMDPFVTLLEVHKLMYFMQEAGEPLRLTYVKHQYGPYAGNLGHVLRTIEGHFVSGYADGGDTPAKQLELVPGAIDEAENLIRGNDDTNGRFERISDLVDGFETPFGLELLATVNWVAVHEKAGTLDELTRKVYEWNERKKGFSPADRDRVPYTPDEGLVGGVVTSRQGCSSPFERSSITACAPFTLVL
jgi:hypothetical protein